MAVIVVEEDRLIVKCLDGEIGRIGEIRERLVTEKRTRSMESHGCPILPFLRLMGWRIPLFR